MRRVSFILRSKRQEKELSLDDIAKKTKISKKYLEALENETIADFPSEPYCSLIIKDYASFLGLNSEQILCFFRRDFNQKQNTNSSFKVPIGVTPQSVFKTLVLLLVIGVTFYLIYQYLAFNRPPQLKVVWPLTTSSQVEISGTTDNESTVRINGDLVLVDTDGKFHKKINLEAGENKITIESRAPSGKTTIQTKTLVK